MIRGRSGGVLAMWGRFGVHLGLLPDRSGGVVLGSTRVRVRLGFGPGPIRYWSGVLVRGRSGCDPGSVWGRCGLNMRWIRGHFIVDPISGWGVC